MADEYRSPKRPARHHDGNYRTLAPRYALKLTPKAARKGVKVRPIHLLLRREEAPRFMRCPIRPELPPLNRLGRAKNLRGNG